MKGLSGECGGKKKKKKTKRAEEGEGICGEGEKGRNRRGCCVRKGRERGPVKRKEGEGGENVKGENAAETTKTKYHNYI